jgi:hypothetical protein
MVDPRVRTHRLGDAAISPAGSLRGIFYSQRTGDTDYSGMGAGGEDKRFACARAGVAAWPVET